MKSSCEVSNMQNGLVYRAKELSLSTAALNYTYLTVVEKKSASPVKLCHDCPVCQKIYDEKMEEYINKFEAC